MLMVTVMDNIYLTRGWQHFPQEPDHKYFKFAVNVVSVVTTHFCHYSLKAVIDNI